MALYYVDFEKVHAGGLQGIEELGRKDEVYIYCREKDVKGIEGRIKQNEIKATVKCIFVDGITKNALDFELVSELFIDKSKKMRIIVSKDKGFDAAIKKGLRHGILCFRREYINQPGIANFWEFYCVSGKEINITEKTSKDRNA